MKDEEDKINLKNSNNKKDKYSSIRDKEYKGVKHPHMSANNRASQFAPFAALPLK